MLWWFCGGFVVFFFYSMGGNGHDLALLLGVDVGGLDSTPLGMSIAVQIE